LANSRRTLADLPWVVLGVGSSKRVRDMQLARSASHLAPACVIEWRDWLGRPDRLDRLLQRPCVLKIEPHGEDAVAFLMLLNRGESATGLPCTATLERGQLLSNANWFAGFEDAMRTIAGTLARSPRALVINRPEDILAMTDKLVCQSLLRAHGVSTAQLLGPIQGYGDLIEKMAALGWSRAFVKARYGSSGAGVIAYRQNGRGREQAITTAQLQHTAGSTMAKLVNVKRLEVYESRDEIRAVIDAVAAQGAYAEAWLQKPRHKLGHFDVRMLTIGGRSAHRVARVHDRPITNLHLDAERVALEDLLTTAQVRLLESTVEHAATLFPGSLLAGFDLCVARDRVRVIEVNAFGDHLPRLLWQGQDVYAATQTEALRDA
jgi:glutathione synthase/RimK-type ligase-like ATP-grasp enzyme